MGQNILQTYPIIPEEEGNFIQNLKYFPYLFRILILNLKFRRNKQKEKVI